MLRLQELGAELVLVAVRVLLDQAVRLQGAQESVHRALRQPQPSRELAYAETARAAAQGLQNANRAIDRLNHQVLIVEWCSTL